MSISEAHEAVTSHFAGPLRRSCLKSVAPLLAALIRYGENFPAMLPGVALSLSADVMLLSSPVALPCRASLAGIILVIIAQPLLTWEVEFDCRRPKLF